MLALLENGYRVTIIDNFDNAFEECFARMQRLAGDKASKMKLIKVPRTDRRPLTEPWDVQMSRFCICALRCAVSCAASMVHKQGACVAAG